MSFIVKKILKKVDKLSLSLRDSSTSKKHQPQQSQCDLTESTHSASSEDSLALSGTPSPPRSPQSRACSARFDRIDFSGLDSALQSMGEKSPSPRTDESFSSSPSPTPRTALSAAPSMSIMYEKQSMYEKQTQGSPGDRKSQRLTRTPSRSRAQQTLDLHLRKLDLLHRCLREEVAEARLLLQRTTASSTSSTSEGEAVPVSAESASSNAELAKIALFQPLVQSLCARGLCVSAHTLYCVCVEVAQRVLEHLLGELEGGARDLSRVSKRLHKLAGALTDADSALCATRARVQAVLSAALGDDDESASVRARAGSEEEMRKLESATAQLLVSVSLDVAKMASKQLPGPLGVEDLDGRVSRALFAHDFEIDNVSLLGFKMNFSSVVERSKSLYMDGINEH